jgi:hypothetical protein
MRKRLGGCFSETTLAVCATRANTVLARGAEGPLQRHTHWTNTVREAGRGVLLRCSRLAIVDQKCLDGGGTLLCIVELF